MIKHNAITVMMLATILTLTVACSSEALPDFGQTPSLSSLITAAEPANPCADVAPNQASFSLAKLSQEQIACLKSDKQVLIIYTTLKKHHRDAFFPKFLETVPGFRIAWLSASSGDVTRRLISEKEAPIADVVWSLGAPFLLQADAAGVLEPFQPVGLENVDKRMRDNFSPPHWVGIHTLVNAICVNTEALAKHNLPMPQSWQDLLDPVYRDPNTDEGLIVMPLPSSSGTGYALITGWLNKFGEEKAWAYMDGLHPNIGEYISSGRRPCNLAADGTYPIGLSFAAAATDKIRETGAPLIVVLPEEGVGWFVEGNAKIRKPETKPIADRFLSWIISQDAVSLDSQFFPFGAVSMDQQLPLARGYPPDAREHLIEQNILWHTANYERITSEWLKRYGDPAGASLP